MYCPKCSAQNEAEQKYCRRCGLPLAILQLAIDGKVDEALATYKKAGDRLSSSTFLVSLCLLGALINIVLIPGPWNAYAVVANSVFGLVIALPLIISGQLRLSRAKRVLSLEGHDHRSIKAEAPETGALEPRSSAVTDPLFSALPIPGSVTEQTTLNLRAPEQKH